MATTDPALTGEALRAAVERIHPAFRGSPQFVHEGLSARAGRPVIVKIESVNPIGAFKGRGTWLVLEDLVEAGEVSGERPVVVASTGNFGQGVAFAGRARGVPVIVFADEKANPLKLERIRQFGARVIQSGDDFDAARAAAEEFAIRSGAYLLIDGREPSIAAGAGTLAIEVTDAAARGELPEPATAYVPVGNGALIVGVGAWLRHAAPGCRVIGVQSEAAPSMTLSWREGRPIETESAATSAEGIATRVPVPEALEMMRDRVDEMRLVSEAALQEAARELSTALGVTAEDAAGASWAAALADPEPAGPALIIVTGGNVAARPDTSGT